MSECSFRWAGDEFEEALPVVTLWGRRWTRPELLARVGRLEQIAGMRLVEGGDGAERGVRILRCTTGAGFDFEILVDRGFDIGGAWIGGRPLAWCSPVGLVGPWYSEPAGLGWFRGFPGGLVSTCGLDHTLLGGPDDASVFNYPHRATETYGLHGRYTGLPARLAGYGTAWDGDDCVLWAEGEVLQAAVFGEQLMLRRRIEADLGGVSLRISDTVTNVGPTRCPHMLLYHCNIGFPVVDDGSELVYPAGPGTCVSAACSPDYQRLTGPGGDFEEECYEHDMRAGPDGLVGAAVVNQAAGLGVFQRYDPATLPRHITWRQLGDVAYVVAMEPSTNRDAGRVHDVRELAARAGADVLVGVDGGVTIANAAEIASWGIDVIVSGSAIFDRVDPAGNLDLLSAQLRTPEEVSDGQR